MNQEHAVLIQKPIEFAGHRTKRRGLNLHEQIGATYVDDEAVQGNLELVAYLSVASFQRCVERALIQGPNVWGTGVDPTIVEAQLHPRPASSWIVRPHAGAPELNSPDPVLGR
jgi:hypothetical protein